jgi:hypothetical protein
MAALNGVVDSVHGCRVGARDYLEVLFFARVGRRTNLAHHLRRRDDVLAREMSASLRHDLILELDGIGPRAF